GPPPGRLTAGSPVSSPTRHAPGCRPGTHRDRQTASEPASTARRRTPNFPRHEVTRDVAPLAAAAPELRPAGPEPPPAPPPAPSPFRAPRTGGARSPGRPVHDPHLDRPGR